jgi:hypothetical protein
LCDTGIIGRMPDAMSRSITRRNRRDPLVAARSELAMMLRVFAGSNWPSALVAAAGATFAILLAIALAFGFRAELRGGNFVDLRHAQFARGLYDGRFGDRSQRGVDLPHAWALTDPGATGDAWYTLTWRLDAVPTTPQALCITALTVPTELYVNGELVAASGPLDGRLP